MVGALIDANKRIFTALVVTDIGRLRNYADENLRARREGPDPLHSADVVGAHLRVEVSHFWHHGFLELREALAKHQPAQIRVIEFPRSICNNERSFSRASC